MTYKTKQRETILHFLRDSDGEHVTATQIVRHLQDSGTPVSIATVYRHLDSLVEEGLVRKYVLDGKTGCCYQYIDAQSGGCAEHFHLICTRCGELFHIECDYLQTLGEHLLDHHGFVLDHTKTVLYGTCRRCATISEEGEKCD